MDYYSDFKDKLPAIQQAYLDSYIEKRRKEGSLSPGEVEKWRASIASNPHGVIESISKSRMIKAEDSGPMYAVEYDNLMDAVKIDLRSLFDYEMVIDNDISLSEGEFKNYIKKASSTIDIIESRLEEYKSLFGDLRGYNAAYHQAFTEENVGRHVGCTISGGYLSLETNRSIAYNNSNNIEKVIVHRYPIGNSSKGIYYASPPYNSIESDYNNVRGSRSMLQGGTSGPGYWLEVLLVDKNGDSRPTTYIDDEMYDGLTIILEIYFTGAYSINEIYLDPISKYMMYVSKIRYSLGDDWKSIKYTDSDNVSKTVSAEGYSGMNLRFDPIVARMIEVTMNVSDSDVVRFISDRKDLVAEKLWDEIMAGDYDDLKSKYSSKDVRAASSKKVTNRVYDKAIIAATSHSNIPTSVKAIIDIDEEVSSTPTWLQPGNEDVSSTIKESILDNIDDLAEVNADEYILGLYSLAPRDVTYQSVGTYYSHHDGGYDTKDGTIRKILLQDRHVVPACTTVEYFIVTDNGVEIPILPDGTITYREPVLVDIDDTIVMETTFTPNGNVSLKRWDAIGNEVVTVDTSVPNDREVTFTGCSRKHSYIIEYDVDVESYDISIPDVMDTVGWYHGEANPDGYKVLLPTTPYIDYQYYSWDDRSWDHIRSLAGFYSDNRVLTQDPNDKVFWEILPARTGVADPIDVSFYHADSASYVISGVFLKNYPTPYPIEYRVRFNGTDRENNEYTYVWYVEPSSVDIDASGLILSDDKMYIVGDPDPAPYPSGGSITNEQRDEYSNVIYNPIELFLDGKKAVDYTNYKEDYQELLEPYASCNEYRYYLDNSFLYTNMNFDAAYPRRLTVRMRYLTSYVRLKIVLRTNTKEASKVTPQVDYYTLKFLSS